MQPFRLHVFVCDQQKPEGVPCCSARGSVETIEALRREVALKGLSDEVQVTTCGSIGLCEHGPNMVVYPEGIWYSGVTAADVPEVVESHFRNGVPVERLMRTDEAAVRAEIVGNRDRMLAARRAKEASGAMPDEWTERIRAFQDSRIILTAVELDLFTTLGEGAGAPELASRLGSDPRATEMLLNALVALRLLSKRDGVYRNGPVAVRFLAAGSPDNAQPALMHRVNLWRTWSALTDCVRAGTAVSQGEMGVRGTDWTEAFIAAMHRNATESAAPVIGAVGAAEVRRMLDVGGGSGAYSIAFALANPDLSSDVLDLPPVAPIAQRHIAQANLGNRVQVRAGDFRTGPLGSGYDLVFVSAICHMLSPEENASLLRRCYEALAPGGRVVVQDFILEPDKTAPKAAALFSLNMLVGTASGASYSEPEYVDWLKAAGFEAIRRVRLPGPAGLMIATR